MSCMQERGKWGAAVLGVLAVAFFGTNPTLDEYTQWLAREVGGQGAGGALMALFGGSLINASTTRDDYLLFSTFTTNVGNGTKFTTFGALRHFVALPAYKPSYPHVVSAGGDNWLPEDGYTWILGHPVTGDLRVKWTSGRLSTNHPHTVSAPAEGRWLPEDGYAWVVNPPPPGDFRVRWSTGQRSSRDSHAIATGTEGHWLPETGYAWVVFPPVPGDLRTRLLNGN
jgi:hypothetical protein